MQVEDHANLSRQNVDHKGSRGIRRASDELIEVAVVCDYREDDNFCAKYGFTDFPLHTTVRGEGDYCTSAIQSQTRFNLPD